MERSALTRCIIGALHTPPRALPRLGPFLCLLDRRPEGSLFIQSFKTVAASPNFEHATTFERRYRFEDPGRTVQLREWSRCDRDG